jgi:hypothetical protein
MSKIIHFLSLLIIIIGCVVSVAAQDDTPPRFEQVMQIELRQIHNIVWHPDGEIIAAAGKHDVWLYDADTLQDVAHLDLRPHIPEQWKYENQMYDIEAFNMGDIRWSPDGRWFMALYHLRLDDEKIEYPDYLVDNWYVWEYENGQFTRIYEDYAIERIKWSPDRSQYAIVNDDGTHIFAAGVHELIPTLLYGGVPIVGCSLPLAIRLSLLSTAPISRRFVFWRMMKLH